MIHKFLMRLVISADRPRRPFPQDYFILTSPDTRNHTPIAEPWVTDPNIIPNGHFDVSVVSDLTYYTSRWRNLSLPSFDHSPFELLPDFIGNVADIISEWYSDDKKIALESADDKDVKKQVEKTAEDYHKKDTIKLIPDGSSHPFLHIFFNEIITKGNIDSNRISEQIYKKYYENDTNVVKDY
ncbi:MAG: hypothetical protein CMC96_08045 [Flavobacteriales bacterium]|nr:hypothetical protein [Flavobacteriales bacterium]